MHLGLIERELKCCSVYPILPWQVEIWKEQLSNRKRQWNTQVHASTKSRVHDQIRHLVRLSVTVKEISQKCFYFRCRDKFSLVKGSFAAFSSSHALCIFLSCSLWRDRARSASPLSAAWQTAARNGRGAPSAPSAAACLHWQKWRIERIFLSESAATVRIFQKCNQYSVLHYKFF